MPAAEQMDATDEVRAGATSEARPSQLIHVFCGPGGGLLKDAL